MIEEALLHLGDEPQLSERLLQGMDKVVLSMLSDASHADAELFMKSPTGLPTEAARAPLESLSEPARRTVAVACYLLVAHRDFDYLDALRSAPSESMGSLLWQFLLAFDGELSEDVERATARAFGLSTELTARLARSVRRLPRR